ncbi:MAG TPA: hypothetical protein VE093_12820 [Polyangiaceae bacterium]|jgi:hypothetical protein|nr:hypothetical protein [Polyangiaceae bacterium]
MPSGSAGQQTGPIVAQAAGCRLDVSVVEATADHLTLKYTFHNGSDRNAYIFNRLYTEIDDSGVFQTEKDRTYVVVEDGGVTLSKKIIAVPPTIDVERPVVPCTTLVKPGDTTSETITVKLPLIPYTPYLRGAAPAPSSQAEPLKASFEIGLFLVPPEGDRLAQRIATTDGTAYRFNPASPASQTILRAGPLPAPLPVRPLK